MATCGYFPFISDGNVHPCCFRLLHLSLKTSNIVCLCRKKKHKKSEELKHLQANEVMTAGETVQRIDSKAASDSNKKTKAELAFQKAKEERVTECLVFFLSDPVRLCISYTHVLCLNG